MSPKSGYVYILKNPEYPGKYKIGKTLEHPEVRANQLSRQTSSIGKFEVLCSYETITPDLAEKFLHVLFERNHFEKEFFDLSEYDEAFLIEFLQDFEEFELTFVKLTAKLGKERIKKMINE